MFRVSVSLTASCPEDPTITPIGAASARLQGCRMPSRMLVNVSASARRAARSYSARGATCNGSSSPARPVRSARRSSRGCSRSRDVAARRLHDPGALPQPDAASLRRGSRSSPARSTSARSSRPRPTASRTCCTWRRARRRPRRSWTWRSRACSGCSRPAARAPRFHQFDPGRRRRRGGSLRLSASGPGHRDAAAHRLPRLLRALEGARRGDARAVRRSSTTSTVCCLRAPWIMEKDDFRYQLSFGEDVFGGPRWRDLVGAEEG